MSSDPTKDLAAFFADLRYESLPAAVRERVIDIVLDTVASAIAGRRGDETAQIEALAASIGGPPRAVDPTLGKILPCHCSALSERDYFTPYPS